jgi:hypothetical protein
MELELLVHQEFAPQEGRNGKIGQVGWSGNCSSNLSFLGRFFFAEYESLAGDKIVDV